MAYTSETEDSFSDDYGTGIEVEDLIGEGRITDPFNPTLIRIDTRNIHFSALMDTIDFLAGMSA